MVNPMNENEEVMETGQIDEAPDGISKEDGFPDDEKVSTKVDEITADIQQKGEDTVVHELIGHIGDEALRLEKPELSEDEKRARNYSECRKYMRNGDILWGTVFGVKNMGGVFCLEVIWNGIIVSFTKKSYFEPEFRFGEGYEAMNEAEKLNREIVLARYQEGATVPFCIANVAISEIKEGPFKGTKTLFVVGDKVKAMQKLREHYFLKTDHPVKVGDLAEAHVLAVRDDKALVECCGCEYRIDAYSLNDRFVESCADWVKPGNKIRVRFRKVHINEDGTVRIAVTGRMKASAEMLMGMSVGSSYLGTVDGYNSYKKHYNVILLNGVTAVIPENNVMMGRSLKVGDQVNVKVNAVLETHIIGSAIRI